MGVQLRHEGLAKTHNLGFGLALRVEVRTTLAAADGKAGQRVLKNLLEAKELDDAQVHARVEAQAALIRAEGRVELHAEATVDLNLAVVIDPWNTEDELAFGLAQPLDQAIISVVRVLVEDDLEGIQDLSERLVEFRFARITLEELAVIVGDLLVDGHGYPFIRHRASRSVLHPLNNR